MTTALQRTGQNGRVQNLNSAPPVVLPGRPPRPRGSWFAREPAWPLIALLAGWPLWWALGLGTYISVFLSIPMARRLYLWHARRDRVIRMPPAYGLWLLFLVVMLAGVTMLGMNAPDTVAGGPVSHRVASWALRALTYGAATVILIYAGNLTEKELSRQRIAQLLGLVCIYAIVFGMAAVGDPGFHFTSPFSALVPHTIQQADTSISAALHPSLTQHQGFSGRGRPAAPFTYSNGWGDNLAILLPWLVVGWRLYGTRRQRLIAGIVLAAALVPIVFSFDRGLWVGLLLAALYVMFRLTTQANLSRLLMFVGGLVLLAAVIAVTPLLGLIVARAQHGSSNAGRASQAIVATKGALSSPVLGYGDTRHEQGGSGSIAIGKSANCPSCGNNDVGAHGQLWMLLFSNGIPGTAFYLGFFGYAVWRFRRDRTPYGMAGVLMLLLGFVFMFVYLTVGVTLIFTVLGYALLWRNDMHMQAEREAAAAGEPSAVAGNGRGSIPGLPA